MKYLISLLLTGLVFFSCLTDEESSDSFSRDDFITVEATVINDTASDAAIDTWYNDTYLPTLMGYDGCKGAYRIKTMLALALDTTKSVDFLPGYLSIFMSSNKDELAGLPGSAQAGEANTAMTAQWPNNEIERSWDVSYEKVESWENESAGKPMQFVTMVPTIAAAGYEDTVNSWEINKHVPDHMKSDNLSRVVRYKKIAGTGANVSGMPDYIEIFYYADQASFEAHNPNDDEFFAAAEADRAATWTNGELEIPWVYSGAIVKESTK